MLRRWRDTLKVPIGLAEAGWDGGCCGAEHGGSAKWDGCRSGLHAVGFCLGGEHALCLVAVALAFAVFLVGVLDGDVLVHEILVVHVGDGVVGGFEIAVGDETVAFGEVGLVAGDLVDCISMMRRVVRGGAR